MTDERILGPEPSGGKMTETATAPVTAEDLAALGSDFRGELVRGELIPMSPNHLIQERVSMALLVPLAQFVREARAGEVFAGNLGYVLERRPDTVRAPDVSFVSNARLAASRQNAFFEGAPDLAVEVRSRSQRFPTLLSKIAQYFEAGTRIVWVVESMQRRVLEYRVDGRTCELTESDTLDGGDVLPGFRLAVADLFEGVERE
jgi:Uma2 family endonuclease